MREGRKKEKEEEGKKKPGRKAHRGRGKKTKQNQKKTKRPCWGAACWKRAMKVRGGGGPEGGPDSRRVCGPGHAVFLNVKTATTKKTTTEV